MFGFRRPGGGGGRGYVPVRCMTASPPSAPQSAGP